MDCCWTNPFVWLFVLFLIYKLIDRLIRIPKIGGAYSPYWQRYVLITGASRGFGYEAVRRLDSLGVHVFAGVRSVESAAKLRADFSTRVDPVLLDVTNSASVRSAFDYVTTKLASGEGKL